VELLNQLIQMVQNDMKNVEESDECQIIRTHFDNTMSHIRDRIAQSVTEGEENIYEGVEV